MKKAAVIGLGNISKRHRRNLKSLFPEIEIIAVPSSGKLPKSQVSDASCVVPTVHEALSFGLDFAIVASPATFHAQHAVQLLNFGVPTLIEKPLSASNQDAASILQAQRNTTTPAALGYCLRYLPLIQELKNIIDSQKLGEIYNVFCDIGQFLPDWRPGKNYQDSVSAKKSLGGGALLELSHEIDYLFYIFGDLLPVSIITKSSKELSLDVEDSADILATNLSGITFSIHLDFLQKQTTRQCKIIAEKGNVICDLIENEIIFIDNTAKRVLYRDVDYDKSYMYIDMLKDFICYINKSKNKSVTIEEGLRVVGFINKCKKMTQGKM